VSVCDWVEPAELAEMLALCVPLTATVVTVNVALVRPAGMVICPGTLAFALLLVSVTGVPPEGAAAARFTVQDAFNPPVTVVGEHTREATPGCVTLFAVRLIEKLSEVPLRVAVITAVVLLATADGAFTVKFAVEEPAATVTGEETVAEPVLLETVTLILLDALPLSVMVQVELPGGVKLAGVHVRFDSTGTPGSRVTEAVLETPLKVAVMVAVVLVATVVVVTGKLAVEVPAVTVTGDETVAEPLLLDTVTLVLLGALPLSVIVQVAPVGGVTLAGLHERPVSVGAGGNRVKLKVLETPLKVAVMVAVVLVATAVVVTGKLAVEVPAVTVTGEETVAEPLLLETVTLMLLAALPLSVMVQVAPVGGVTLAGLQLKPESTMAGVRVSEKVWEVPFRVAVIVAVVLLATAVVVTGKLAVEEPAVTVTGEETVAEPLLLETVTLMLLAALPLSVMVQVAPVGGVTLDGLHERPVSVGVAGSRVTEEVLEVPFRVAVIVAVVLVATAVVVTRG